MKHLPLPIVDDVAALNSVVERNPLASCPHILNDVAEVRARYVSYVNVRGNPHHPDAPQPIDLRGLLGNALPKRYTDHSHELDYIDEIRTNGSPYVCPMCGAPKPATVDHVFPQNPFKELAIFSGNLVPACSECNRGRQNRYRGNNPGERILHPYFDACLEDRIVRATIAPVEGSFRTPEIDLEVILNANDPLYPAVNYHLQNVVKPAGVITSLGHSWINLQRVPDQDRLPHVYFQTLPIGHFSDLDFDQAVDIALELADAEFHTKNNWKSMLLAGLAINMPAKEFLAQTIRELRLRPDEAEDI